MRNNKHIVAVFSFALLLLVIPATTRAVDFTEPFVSESMNPPAVTTLASAASTDDANNEPSDTPPENLGDNEPSQRDQTPNSGITRAFLKGAGYTAPSVDMTCAPNSQGVEVCVPSNDLRAYIVDIIKVVLSVVGFLFFGLLVYAGYLWTTAGGNDEAVKKAQGIATKAIIGFTLILAAYAITTFITGFLQRIISG